MYVVIFFGRVKQQTKQNVNVCNVINDSSSHVCVCVCVFWQLNAPERLQGATIDEELLMKVTCIPSCLNLAQIAHSS